MISLIYFCQCIFSTPFCQIQNHCEHPDTMASIRRSVSMCTCVCACVCMHSIVIILCRRQRISRPKKSPGLIPELMCYLELQRERWWHSEVASRGAGRWRAARNLSAPHPHSAPSELLCCLLFSHLFYSNFLKPYWVMK